MGYNTSLTTRAIFISLAIVGCQICEITQNFERIRGRGHRGHPRSLILVQLKSIC